MTLSPTAIMINKVSDRNVIYAWNKCHQLWCYLILSVRNRVDALNFAHIYSGAIKQQDRWAQY